MSEIPKNRTEDEETKSNPESLQNQDPTLDEHGMLKRGLAGSKAEQIDTGENKSDETDPNANPEIGAEELTPAELKLKDRFKDILEGPRFYRAGGWDSYHYQLHDAEESDIGPISDTWGQIIHELGIVEWNDKMYNSPNVSSADKIYNKSQLEKMVKLTRTPEEAKAALEMVRLEKNKSSLTEEQYSGRYDDLVHKLGFQSGVNNIHEWPYQIRDILSGTARSGLFHQDEVTL